MSALILYAEQWSFPDEKTGELRTGAKFRMITDGSPIRDDRRNGLTITEASASFEVSSALPALPVLAVVDASLVSRPRGNVLIVNSIVSAEPVELPLEV